MKLGDGWAVLEGREALVRGLRERREAYTIRHDLERKGWFGGEVTFRSGRRGWVAIPPAESQQFEPPARDAGEGTVDDL